MKKLCILIVGENATNTLGGEAILSLHYFRFLQAANIETYLVTHARVKASLEKQDDLAHDHIYYVPDNGLFKGLNWLGEQLPPRIAWLFISTTMYLMSSFYQWFIIRKVVKEKQVSVIHQPIPVSPKLPSGVFGFGVPVVIGPMNGGMHFPPAFSYIAANGELFFVKWLRRFSDWLKWLIPGKHFAKILLVANMRTKQVLTPSEQKKARILPENGVLNVMERTVKPYNGKVNCLFVGRLVDWKAVDIIIEAVARSACKDLILTIVGAGAEENSLKALVKARNVNNIIFAGFQPFESVNTYYDQADIFLLPSVRECGGAVVLEAMSRGLPVIATDWGGPTDYVTPETGILVAPDSREELIEGFKQQIEYLAANPALREQMGKAGIETVTKHYLWKDKIKKIVQLYQELV